MSDGLEHLVSNHGPVLIPNSFLTRLVTRLEAATSRLEDIASSSASFEQAPATNGATPVAGATAAASSAPAPTIAAPGKTKVVDFVPPTVEAFDQLLNTDLKAFTSCSNRLGGVLAEVGTAVAGAFNAQRQFLLVTTKAKKPEIPSPTFMETLKDLQREIMKVEEMRQSNRELVYKNALSMVADGCGALGWVTVDNKPADQLSELFGGAQMYGNKVLKESKEKDQPMVEWVQSFYKLFKSLVAYVKQHHTNGVVWNPSGINATEAVRQVKEGGSSVPAAPSAPPAGAGAPPPPPPPLPTFDNVPPPPPQPKANAAPASDMGAVFDQLNQGEAVTKGLKKVDPSQMTHKNPSLRAQAPVPTRSDSSGSLGRSKSPTPPKKPKPESMRTKKPPRKELDGNKWIIENYDNPGSPIEIEASITQSILISRCSKTTIRISGKANAISLDNSPSTSIIIDSLVSSIDIIKCPKFALQVLGTLPTILLDQVEGATIYLSKESMNVVGVFTSRCTSVNVNLPPDDEEGDYSEAPLPEQIRSYVKNGRMVSEIVEHAG